MKWSSILLGIITVLSITGCNEEKEDNSLKVLGAEDNLITLYYPNDNLACITLDGGVRPYQVESLDTDILNAYMDKWPNAFNYEVLGIGKTQVKVTDAAGESILVDIEIKYYESNYKINRLDCYIEGDNMTITAQNELKEKVLASIPVKEGGGYKFIYTENTSGIVQVYTENMGGSYVEGTFYEARSMEENEEHYRIPVFVITVKDEKYTCFLQQYPFPTRAAMRESVAFYTDLLERYKIEYPEAEVIYSIQVVGN